MENIQYKSKFTEIAKIKIADNKNIVVSKRDDGFVSIAQQLVVEQEGANTITLFLKNAIVMTEDAYEDFVKKLSLTI